MDNYTSFKKFHVNSKASLYLGDTVDVMSQLPSESIDMIFADPPYFLSNGGISVKSGKIVNVDKGEWDKIDTFEEMHNFNREWLLQCRRLLKNNGTIWITGTHHNIFSVGMILKELDFHFLNHIIWVKTSPPPNITKRMFTFSHENVLWAKKYRSERHTFNYDLIKSLNQGYEMTDVWHIPHVPLEEKKFGYHPTQKPLKLLNRIVISSTRENALVLDPFCGSGTTGVAALIHNRRFIGIDNNFKYINLSFNRLRFTHLKK